MLGEKMKLIRNYNGYSQRQIAEILKIERSTYASYETGRIFLRFSALQKSSMSAWIIF
mgnify:CR=1 FL=1